MSPMLWLAPIVVLLATSTCSANSVGRKLQEVYSMDAESPPSVDLKTAEDFTVLAATTITNAGPTTVGGFIGVSPGSAVAGETDISYFRVPTPYGRVSTSAAAIAKEDVADAYNDAQGRVKDVVNINVVNIGGLTFTPGLYKSTDSLQVSSGTLYLKGNGVFIFQMEKEFSVSTNLKMVLQEGAQASNVFWVVGTSAVFEVGSKAVGTFMAHQSISAKTGASIVGRLFALNAAVTMLSNSVDFPASASSRRSLQAKAPTPPVDLGDAEDFTVLAASTVTNDGPTTIGGYLGVSPGSNVTGQEEITYDVVPAQNGRASPADAAAAKADAADAYDDASSRVLNANKINVVNIGGLTFTPGLYKSTGALEVSSGTVYLSGLGVYIFQMESTFVVLTSGLVGTFIMGVSGRSKKQPTLMKMATGMKMVLQDGAQAKDIYWTVGSSATFEVSTEAVGTFMAHQSISVNTGASIYGRLFAINAAVTLLSNDVSYPYPQL